MGEPKPIDAARTASEGHWRSVQPLLDLIVHVPEESKHPERYDLTTLQMLHLLRVSPAVQVPDEPEEVQKAEQAEFEQLLHRIDPDESTRALAREPLVRYQAAMKAADTQAAADAVSEMPPDVAARLLVGTKQGLKLIHMTSSQEHISVFNRLGLKSLIPTDAGASESAASEQPASAPPSKKQISADASSLVKRAGKVMRKDGNPASVLQRVEPLLESATTEERDVIVGEFRAHYGDRGLSPDVEASLATWTELPPPQKKTTTTTTTKRKMKKK